MEGMGEPYGRRMADTACVVEERVANEDGVEKAWWAEEPASDVSPPTEVTRRGFTLSIERTVPEGEAGGGETEGSAERRRVRRRASRCERDPGEVEEPARPMLVGRREGERGVDSESRDKTRRKERRNNGFHG